MKVAIIQARMGSERLPGKVLMDIHGQSMLQRIVQRVRRSQTIGRIVVATTRHSQDNALEQFCRDQSIDLYRGEESDVLDRYYRAARSCGASIVVRITADCPLLDPQLLDAVVNTVGQSDGRLDYACNFYPLRFFPRGLDVEAVTFETLHEVWQHCKLPHHREHVTTAIYEHPERFHLGAVRNTSDQSYLRWTVDTLEDLQLVRAIYSYFGDAEFKWTDVIQAYRVNPSWLAINDCVEQKKVAA